MIKFTKRVTNEGTVIFTISFFEAGTETAVTPKTIEYDLINGDREVVNNRFEQDVTPASTIELVFAGPDIDQDDGLVRYISLRCTYDSIDYGNDRPLNGQIKFLIEPWKDTIAPTP